MQPRDQTALEPQINRKRLSYNLTSTLGGFVEPFTSCRRRSPRPTKNVVWEVDEGTSVKFHVNTESEESY